MEKYLVYCLLLGVFISACTAVLQCHQCAMIGGDDCGDYYDGVANADNVGECGEKDTHCVKFKTTIRIRDSGYINGKQRESIVVSRGCERADGYGDGCYATAAVGGVIIKCRCSSDGCNTGNSIYTTATTLPIACLLAAMALFFSRR